MTLDLIAGQMSDKYVAIIYQLSVSHVLTWLQLHSSTTEEEINNVKIKININVSAFKRFEMQLLSPKQTPRTPGDPFCKKS